MNILEQLSAAKAQLAKDQAAVSSDQSAIASLQAQLEKDLVLVAYDCSVHPSKIIAEYPDAQTITVDNPQLLNFVLRPTTLPVKGVSFNFTSQKGLKMTNTEGTTPFEFIPGSNNDITKLVGKRFDDDVCVMNTVSTLTDGSNQSKTWQIILKTPQVVTTPVTPPASGNSFEKGAVAVSSFKSESQIKSQFGTTDYKTYLKKAGIKWAREWLTYKAGQAPSSTSLKSKYQPLVDMGLKVIVCIAVDEGLSTLPNAADVSAYFKAVAQNTVDAGLKDSVYYELGNEPNLTNYWHGTVDQYIQLYLKPAAAELKAKGVKALGAGVSWNPDVVIQIFQAMQGKVDGYSYHPYQKADLLKAYMDKIVAVTKDAPLYITEFNMGRTIYSAMGSDSERLAGIKAASEILKKYPSVKVAAYHILWSSPTASNAFWIMGSDNGAHAWTLIDKNLQETAFGAQWAKE